ncbi:MAG: ATP-dependent sacrificial sulfur transferase LarE [Magnetococcales bacterium]|nr:ATP-dependent sacrificial sulfur transferase LarE [Magnetococcales bacterium]
MISTRHTSLTDKYQTLQGMLRSMENVLVAFSGGVDSTFLVRAVLDAGIPYLAVTATSPTMPARDLEDVHALVQGLNLRHRLIESGEIRDPEFVRNGPDRCFHCKSDLFKRLSDLARAEGFSHVLDGTNTEDLGDYRPGLQAKKGYQVVSPLLEADLNKQEIRLLSREKGLATWDKPASPCLSSRISYGEPILVSSLRMVERSETWLKSRNFTTVRVRKQGECARIEVSDEELPRLLDARLRKQVTAAFQQIGFKFVTLDLEGFQSGKLNRVIPVTPHPV